MIAASALKQELVISGLSKKLMSRLNQSFSKVFQTISAFRRKFLDPSFWTGVVVIVVDTSLSLTTSSTRTSTTSSSSSCHDFEARRCSFPEKKLPEQKLKFSNGKLQSLSQKCSAARFSCFSFEKFRKNVASLPSPSDTMSIRPLTTGP